MVLSDLTAARELLRPEVANIISHLPEQWYAYILNVLVAKILE